ncbi:MAG: AMP-binding protein [Steroidobacteraceae bacterium]
MIGHPGARSSNVAAAKYRAERTWQDKTSAQNFDAFVERDPTRMSLRQGTLHLTREALRHDAARLAHTLQRMGLRRGDVVSFMTPNWPEAAVLHLAASMTGLIVNPIVPIYRAAESRFILQDCASKLLVVPETFRGFDYLEMAKALRADLPELRHIVTVRGTQRDGALSFSDLVEQGASAAFVPVPVDPDSIKLILYTSGTTGRAKGVLHSHNTIGAEIRNLTAHWSITERDTVFMPSPLTHITGYLYGIQLVLSVGCKAVYLDEWNAAIAFDLIANEQCTFCVGATPFLQQLRETAQSRHRTLDSLRYFACGGAPVPPDLIYSAREAMPECVVCRVYGSTEAPTITWGPTSKQENLAATTDGLVVGHEVKLVTADGRVAGVGEEGEVLTRGPEVFLGYTNSQDTADAFDEEGYFRMGDLARWSAPGWLTITGRVKDLIIRGGENISAKEIEDVLHQHPAIREAAVVAAPHPKLGETCCAFVILESGASLTLQQVVEFVAQMGLAKQKTPERLEIVAEFPRTAAGKIRKVELRERVAAQCVSAGNTARNDLRG